MNCKNCKSPLLESNNYCPKCGQKNILGRLTTKAFLLESWNEFLRFDRRFFRTLVALFIPGKLTNEFIEGKGIKYIKAIRLYIGLSILMIATLNIYLDNPFQYGHTEFESYTLALDDELKLESESLDYLKRNQFTLDVLKRHNSNLLEIQPSIPQEHLDTITKHTLAESKIVQKDSVKVLQYDFKAGTLTEQQIALQDLFNLDRDALYKLYNIPGWVNKKLLNQNLRFYEQGSNFLIFIMQKTGICILFMIPFLALVLKLVYVRNPFYYAEHLAFALNTHSFLFLLVTFVYILFASLGKAAAHFEKLLLVFPIYLFLSLLLVYKQNFFKTTLKFIIINISYVILAAISIIILASISFLFF